MLANLSKIVDSAIFIPYSQKTSTLSPNMSTLATLALGLSAFVALQHIGFLVLEMFLWTKPAGRKTFGLTREFAESTKVLAANQGLYNGFLAAGLAWGCWLGAAGTDIRVFFLGCVVVAGVFGGATASWRILLIQALPAAIALALTLL
jgi:putative membrane protein